MNNLQHDRTDKHFSHYNHFKERHEDLIRRKGSGNVIWLLKRGDHTEVLSKERAKDLEELYAEEHGDGTPHIVQNS